MGEICIMMPYLYRPKKYFRYWGWGAEDDDIFARLRYKGFHPQQLRGALGRFKVRQQFEAVNDS